ncbi:3-isopropylmalate dehydratase small subunit [Azospirillum sp. YIM DDC1]|uniref:3-isopropylmalate dehydratase small subunit n=1 Tax=Azospirillum aestuarii TaxID=2802052 RepID=A0ABS1I3N2_9PROT|nr:3-isopropylmalate dehydratase small subunit [Azospirillum aestuarii]MBK4721690.1 3-isopropylmalate dehydratase small subunit [Azospirillum aestuarii]
MPEPINRITGIAAPLPQPNVDTDAIIPKAHLLTIHRSGLGAGLFSEWRFDEDDKERPDFVLNQAPWREATILLAGENFGCGSSREHAVWSLMDFGIRCVIAPSFASIFHENCQKNGLAAVTLDEAALAHLVACAQATPAAAMTVDIDACRVTASDGREFPFTMETARRQALLEGLDEIGASLRHDAAMAAFEARDRAQRPWIHALPTA